MALLAAGMNVQRASADWTVGGFVGAAHTQSSSIRLIQESARTDVTLSPVRYRSQSFDAPIYYGYRVGLFPRSGWFGVEGEFMHLKVVAETARTASANGVLRGAAVSDTRPVSSVIERFSITHGVNLVLVNAVARYMSGRTGLSGPRLMLTGRVGAGASVPHAESTIGGISREQYEWGSFSIQGAAGVEVRLANRLYAAGEYKITHTAQDVSVTGGSVRTPLTSHHATGGVVIHLGTMR